MKFYQKSATVQGYKETAISQAHIFEAMRVTIIAQDTAELIEIF